MAHRQVENPRYVQVCGSFLEHLLQGEPFGVGFIAITAGEAAKADASDFL